MGILSIARRAIKILPEVTFGTGAEVFGAGYRSVAKDTSIWTKVKEAGKAVEKDIAKQGGGGFFKRCWKSLTSLGHDMAAGARMGYKKAKVLNRKIEEQLGSDVAKLVRKSPIKSAFRGIGKAISKRLPLIGVVATAIFDGPKIFDAFKNKGFFAGLKETTGVGVELGCMAAGAAIGSCICPVGGTLVGGIVGAVAGMFVRDSVFSTEDLESEKSAVEYTKEEIATLKQLGLNDEEIKYAKEMGLSFADIQKVLNGENVQVQKQDTAQVKNPAYEEKIPQDSALEEQTEITDDTAAKQDVNKNPYTSFGSMTIPKVDVNQALGSVYSQLGATGLYNPYGIGNIYSNDMYYKQAFNGIGQYQNVNLNSSNPFGYQMPYYDFT